ncbi:MAG: hypothetical protein LBB90_06905 [Tannerella sp.]|jgi:hypothetical protein|nr:hypothetical protein [Tannerella sp.]
MERNPIEAQAANTILDRGVRYRLGEDDITIRPLRFGTLIMIAGMAAEAGLTQQKIDEGEGNLMQFVATYADLMLRCVAVAEINSREELTDGRIRERADFYRDCLNAFQIYELFVHVLSLSGVQSFTNTIRLLVTMKTKHLSPMERGS